jgi:hypothetical protein
MRAFYKNLIAARRANPALSIGAYKRLSADGDLLVFERSDAASGNAVVVAVNRGTADASVTVPAPTIWADAVPTDVLAMTKATRDGANLTLSVPARTAQVWALPAKSR